MLRLLTYRTEQTNDWNFDNLTSTYNSIILKQEVQDFKVTGFVFEAYDVPSKPPHIGRLHR